MSAVTYGDRYGSAATAAVKPRRTGWFARFLDRAIAVRVQQAAREVELHLGYLPYSLDQRGDRLVKTGHKDMPFGT